MFYCIILCLFCIIVTKLCLEAVCTLIYRNRNFNITIKLNRTNTLLFTMRNYVNKHILRTIYFGIFNSHINYANLIWEQNLLVVSRIVILQRKALRIINFQSVTQVRYSNPPCRKNCMGSILHLYFRSLKSNRSML